MMGRKHREQASLFYEFRLDDMIPKGHLLRRINVGLLGLHIPRHLGGLGEGLLSLAIVTEELGRACGSTAMCFGMHCVASKVLAAKATKYQEDQYLRPIAEGRHITTLALSEPGTGAHFFLPRSHYWVQGDDFVLDGQKSFVTSGSHADSYVVSVVPPGAELDPGTFTCLVMDSDSPGIEWLEAFRTWASLMTDRRLRRSANTVFAVTPGSS